MCRERVQCARAQSLIVCANVQLSYTHAVIYKTPTMLTFNNLQHLPNVIHHHCHSRPNLSLAAVHPPSYLPPLLLATILIIDLTTKYPTVGIRLRVSRRQSRNAPFPLARCLRPNINLCAYTPASRLNPTNGSPRFAHSQPITRILKTEPETVANFKNSPDGRLRRGRNVAPKRVAKSPKVLTVVRQHDQSRRQPACVRNHPQNRSRS